MTATAVSNGLIWQAARMDYLHANRLPECQYPIYDSVGERQKEGARAIKLDCRVWPLGIS
jgi:hypothetical protein